MNGVGAVIEGMTNRKRGHIINMSSNAGRRVSISIYIISTSTLFKCSI